MSINSGADYKLVRTIAFYLPQFHPISKTISGGAKDLRNGSTLRKLSLCSKVERSVPHQSRMMRLVLANSMNSTPSKVNSSHHTL